MTKNKITVSVTLTESKSVFVGKCTQWIIYASHSDESIRELDTFFNSVDPEEKVVEEWHNFKYCITFILYGSSGNDNVYSSKYKFLPNMQKTSIFVNVLNSCTAVLHQD